MFRLYFPCQKVYRHLVLLLVRLYHHFCGRYSDFVVCFIVACWLFRGRELAAVYSELILAFWLFAVFGYKAKPLENDSSVLLSIASWRQRLDLLQRVVEFNELIFVSELSFLSELSSQQRVEHLLACWWSQRVVPIASWSIQRVVQCLQRVVYFGDLTILASWLYLIES